MTVAPSADSPLVIEVAAANLVRARRHAVWLERIAISVLTLGFVVALGTVAVGIELVLPALAVALAGAVVWGVLRALALHLHLAVDQTMIELDE